MSRAWAGGSTRAWRTVRAMVLARDLYQCKIQGEGCTRVATQAHHLHGKRYGDDPRYLVAACRTCNLAAGDPTSGGDPPPQPRTQW